jgi:hypothetical protein
MFVPVVCPQCGKPFQVPDAAIGKPTACPWCLATVLALPVGGQSPADAAPIAPPEPTGTNSNTPAVGEPRREELPRVESAKPLPEPELLSLDDAPPSQQDRAPLGERRRPEFPIGHHACVVLVGLFLVIAVGTITFVILRYKQGHLASMEWKAFTAPDGSCGIDLLGLAREEDSDPEHGVRRYVSEGRYSGRTTWIGWRNLTAAQVQEAHTEKGWVQLREKFFDPERDRLKEKFGGYIARDATIGQNPITVEVRVDGPQGPLIERMIVMPEGPRPRVYFIGMVGKRLDLDGPEVKRLFESFRVYD